LLETSQQSGATRSCIFATVAAPGRKGFSLHNHINLSRVFLFWDFGVTPFPHMNRGDTLVDGCSSVYRISLIFLAIWIAGIPTGNSPYDFLIFFPLVYCSGSSSLLIRALIYEGFEKVWNMWN